MRAGEVVRIAVVIPSYRVSRSVLDVIRRIGPEAASIYVVDDACPEQSGERVSSDCRDPRVRVIRHSSNQGVGGAVMTGYRAAMDDGADIVVKLDGDGQMAPELLPTIVTPLLAGEADYAKGNRFFDLDGLSSMPAVRLWGNAILSILSKLSTGYWNVVDPTNGYTAIHASVAAASSAAEDQPELFLRDGSALPAEYAARGGRRRPDGRRVRGGSEQSARHAGSRRVPRQAPAQFCEADLLQLFPAGCFDRVVRAAGRARTPDLCDRLRWIPLGRDRQTRASRRPPGRS